MAVKIRMTRMGRRHRPFFRINAVESRTPRDGRILEKLGHFDPLVKNVDEQLVLDNDRVMFWLDKGAIPTETIIDFLNKRGITCSYMEAKVARREKAKKIARAKGIPFTKADKIAAEKAVVAAKEAAEKAAEEAAAAAEAAEKAKAEAAAAKEAAKAEAEKAKAEAAAAKEAAKAEAEAAKVAAKEAAEAAKVVVEETAEAEVKTEESAE